MKNGRLAAVLVAAAAVFACSDAASPGDEGTLTLRFGLDDGAISAAVAGLSLSTTGVSGLAALPLEGTNGTLSLDEIWLVADEFKLELLEGTCEEGDETGCENFELAPFFASVPLEGEDTGNLTAEVTPGSYQALKFETKAAAGGTLLDEIRETFDDWPGSASLLVIGTFTPTDGDPVAFRVYFDAEVKVVLAFEEPLVIGEAGQFVTVFVDPAIWFANGDGTVDDLSAFDYDTTGEVVTFEAKFEDGFTKIELGDE
jgi:hypothetical protein